MQQFITNWTRQLTNVSGVKIMSVRKIKPEYFNEVKWSIRWNRSMKKVAAKHGISLSTVLNIKGCKNYTEYMELVRSEHQPTQFSLRDEVLALHKTVFDKGDSKYHEPLTARIAVTQLNYELAKR